MFDITTSIDLSKLVPLNNEGRNSTVYTYYDEQLGKDFIIKIISKETLYNQYGSDYLNNLFSEPKILYSNKHPNIVEIQYASYDNDNVYISMPKCKYGSLDSLINKRFLTVREIIKYSLEFLSGLHFIHTKELMHFDIKPTNILINDNGKAVVTDFGLAKYSNNYGLAEPDFLYNMHKPPEFFSNRQLTNKSDIYQAGLTMYRLCNGNEIFKQQYRNSSNWQRDVIQGIIPDRKFYLPHIPISLQRIINKSIDINPDKRFETILDMVNKLSNIDENLDWRFSINSPNEYQWISINDKGTHTHSIIMVKNVNTTYDIKTQKINIEKGNTITVRDLCHTGQSLDNAYKLVAKIIEMC